MNQALSGWLVILFLASVIGVFVSMTKKNKSAAGWCGFLAFVLFIIIVGSGYSSNSNSTTVADASTPAPTDAPSTPEPTVAPDVSTPDPTPEPTENPAQAKRDFIASVDESVSGARIAGNKLKFVGQNVDLHGTVESIVDGDSFNLSTGSISVGDDGSINDNVGVIVVHCDSTTDLEKGQKLRVLGTVTEPVDGTNAMGGEMTFPTVEAKFME